MTPKLPQLPSPTAAAPARFIAKLSVALAVLSCASLVVYGAGEQEGPVPAYIGAAGINADGEPGDPDEVRGKAGEGGKIWIDVSHATKVRQGDGPSMTGLYVNIISPKNAKVADIETACAGGSPFEDHKPEEDPNGDGDTEDADKPSETASADVGDGSNAAAFGDTITIKLKVVDENGEPLDEDQRVTFEVWWTRDSEVVANTNTDKVGETAGLSIARIVPDYNTSTVQVSTSASAGTATCNDIALGETYGYYFQDGDFVLAPNNEARFVITADTEILAFNKAGRNVTGTTDFSTSDLRIDDAGNFVFRVSRDQEDTPHLAIVIRGLGVDLPGLQVGDVVTGTVSGAAVSGIHADDIYDLVAIVE